MAIVAIIGSSGFLGTSLVEYLCSKGHQVICISRSSTDLFEKSLAATNYTCGLTCSLELATLLENVYCCINLVSLAHLTSSRPDLNSFHLFYKSNICTVKTISEACVLASVPLSIYISSIGVNGQTSLSHSFSSSDIPSPSGPYALSKFVSEQIFLSHFNSTHLSCCVLRLPLVYGLQPKGNLFTLLQTAKKFRFLPFAGLVAPKNFLDIDLFNSSIERLIVSAPPQKKLYLLADSRTLSTSHLCAEMTRRCGVPCLHLSIHPALLALGFFLLFRYKAFQKLFLPLAIDSSDFEAEYHLSLPHQSR